MTNKVVSDAKAETAEAFTLNKRTLLKELEDFLEQVPKDLADIEREWFGEGKRFADWTAPANTIRWAGRLKERLSADHIVSELVAALVALTPEQQDQLTEELMAAGTRWGTMGSRG